MPHSSAYLLVIHGSSDPRPWNAATTLAEAFAQRIGHVDVRGTIENHRSHSAESGDPSTGVGSLQRGNEYEPPTSLLTPPLVGVASLELGDAPLHQQIARFVRQQLHDRTTSFRPDPLRLTILPLFLLRGVHVMEDIPAEIALARELLRQEVTIEVAPHLGSHPGLGRLVTEQMAALPVEAWVLVAHGSQRLEANQTIEAFADRLGAVTAYWSIAPDLETRLQELQDSGLNRIAVFPYFLFSGGIIDAIAQTVDRCSQQFPSLQIKLLPPFNAAPEIADLLVELAAGKGGGRDEG